ncbi:hypothetical protein NGB36_28255 [Streptomyces sp. RB6PN25]|uniref:Uncharacterized protein n=1 Tax=Streptomyces humicola TaxID=2953240 RepID=A0ABT1Q3A7_9ACTN|nr:hypothetical protein [Streptomyces humicola]MCQ4084369.1 hypothetical protein [Streptomyces humicola]
MIITPLAEALRRDAAVLLDAYRTHRWVPQPGERELADELARGRWDAQFLRAALRKVPPDARGGRLIDVLEPATEVFDQAADKVPAAVMLQLRVLVDALTTTP